MTMSLVSTVTVGAGGAASIEFTGIPQTGQDLLVVMSLRDSVGEGSQNNVRFNGDSAANYSYKALGGLSSVIYNYTGTATSVSPLYTNFSTATASTFSNSQLYIPNYKSASAKSISSDIVTETNAANAFTQIGAHNWSGTAAITSLTIYAQTSLVQYSTASLYTISTTGATGATVA